MTHRVTCGTLYPFPPPFTCPPGARFKAEDREGLAVSLLLWACRGRIQAAALGVVQSKPAGPRHEVLLPPKTPRKRTSRLEPGTHE